MILYFNEFVITACEAFSIQGETRCILVFSFYARGLLPALFQQKNKNSGRDAIAIIQRLEKSKALAFLFVPKKN
jgi:hypothetical protein